ncbi:BTB/POZ domain-containing protein kctd6 [Trebouxia sp. C0010 RCD-2024]
MFSGDMQPALRDPQGRFFVDRSGDWFAVILSYSREDSVQIPPFGIQRQALAGEAHYFQLQELEQQLAAGLPISKAANKVGSSDLQAVVAKLTYQEGCAALYDSAKEHIGVKKVHAK